VQEKKRAYLSTGLLGGGGGGGGGALRRAKRVDKSHKSAMS